MSPLRLEDLSDLRAYERERDVFRAEVIALKRIRRVAIGPVVSVVFENATTVRFQVQEMVRAERILDDAAVQGELDAYNPLIPAPGELSATLFIELTSDDELREWLPKLVGVERHLVLRLGAPRDAAEVRGEVDPGHATQLTRDEITASVHYIKLRLGPVEQARLASGPAVLAIDHPAYEHEATLTEATIASILHDWSTL